MKFNSKSPSFIRSFETSELFSRASILWIGLTFSGYFLITSRQGSAIPTYMLAIIGLLGCVLNPSLHLKRILRTKSFLFFLAFLSYLLLSMSWNVEAIDNPAIYRSVLIDAMVLLFVGVSFIQVRKDIDLTGLSISLMVLGAGLSASILLLVEFTEFRLAHAGAWNVWSVGAIAYGFSAVAATYYAVMYRATIFSLGYGSVALVSLAAVMLLDSQLVFFGLLVALVSLSFAALWESRFRRQSLLWAVACALLMVVVLVMLNELMEEKRSAIWASTLDSMFNKALFFGVGYPSVSTPVVACTEVVSSVQINGDCIFDHPHNLFVNTIFQLGLVGFLILFSFYLVGLSVLFEQRTKDRLLLGSCLFYGGAIFMFDGQLLVENMSFIWLLFWLPMFLVMREEFLRGEM